MPCMDAGGRLAAGSRGKAALILEEFLPRRNIDCCGAYWLPGNRFIRGKRVRNNKQRKLSPRNFPGRSDGFACFPKGILNNAGLGESRKNLRIQGKLMMMPGEFRLR